MSDLQIEITTDMVGKVFTLMDPPPPPKPLVPLPDVGMLDPIYYWDFGALSEESVHAYNQWAQQIEATPRPPGHPRYVFDDHQVIEVSMRTSPPRIVDGKLSPLISQGFKDPSGHCEWRPRHLDLIKTTYLHLNATYVWHLRTRLQDYTLDRAAKYPDSHITFLQVVGPPGIPHPPAFALQVYKGTWRVQSLADDIDQSIHLGPPDAAWHDWWALYKPSPSDGLLRVWCDGHVVADITGATHYTPPSDKRGWAGQQRFGCYATPTPEPVGIEHSQVKMWQLAD